MEKREFLINYIAFQLNVYSCIHCRSLLSQKYMAEILLLFQQSKSTTVSPTDLCNVPHGFSISINIDDTNQTQLTTGPQQQVKIVHLYITYTQSCRHQILLYKVSNHNKIDRSQILLTITCYYKTNQKPIEAQARLIFGSSETRPVIWIGKPAPAIQCQLRVER